MTSSLGKDIVRIARFQILTTVVGFGTQIFLARYLGPEQKGVLDLFLLLPVVLVSITELGLVSANTYFAGKAAFQLSILHTNSLMWSLGIGSIALATGVLLISTIGSPFESLTASHLLLSLLVVLPSLYFSLWSGLMYGRGQAGTVYFITAAFSVVSIAAYGVALLLEASLSGIIQLSALLLFVRTALALYALRGRVTLSYHFDTLALKKCLQYGFALWFGLVINTLHFRVSQFLVSSMLGSAELAFYALAVRIAEMAWLLDFVIINATVFRITSSSKEDSVRITQRMTRAIGMISLGSSLLIGIVSPVAIPLFFGEAFRPTVPLLLLFLPGIVGWSLARSLSQFVAYQAGKPWYTTGPATLAFIVNILLNLVLLPILGTAGASIAASLSYLGNLFLISIIFKRMSSASLVHSLKPTKEDFRMLRDVVTQYLPRRTSDQE